MNRLFLLLSLAVCFQANAKEVKIDNNLPYGNIKFEKMCGDTVYLHQELRDTEGDWFYWAMRIRGAQGRTLTFVFTQSRAVGVRGPVVSFDKGKTFDYVEVSNLTRKTFTYAFPKNTKEVWMYECHPYGLKNWTTFVKGIKGVPVETGVLCRGRKGTNVPYLKIGSGPVGLVLSARHHCSEASASFVLEGIVSTFAEQSESGEKLRSIFNVSVVPFVDLDGVIDGDQGKNRRPHDHNRDYTEFLYPETAAFAELLKQVSPKVYLDLHAPGLCGWTHEFIYTPFTNPDLGSNVEKEHLFSSLVEKNQEGGLRYKTTDDLPFGVGWNKAVSFSAGLSAAMWAQINIPGIEVCRTMEFPFANANGAVVTPEALREFGHGIAKALLEMYGQKE